jgi:NAD(P)-dependent dehydrogenase (short-subunit alcohol dehydrogenase family)
MSQDLTVFITGANRGIGLEFARQYLEQDARVLASCPCTGEAPRLHELAAQYEGRCTVLELDVLDTSAMAALPETVQDLAERLDLLINNAAQVAHGEEGLASLEAERMLHVLRVNLLGPMLVTRALWPLLRRAPRPVVASLVSRTGVLREGLPPPLGQYSYGVSKAALNLALPLMAADLMRDNIIVVGLDPGYVDTDMTRGGSDTRYKLDASTSVRGMMSVIERLSQCDTGRCFRHDGRACRWYAPAESAEERQELPAPRPHGR